MEKKQPANNIPPIGAVLTGPHWPARVRVVRVEPRGTSRVLIEAVTLDEDSRLISRLLKLKDLEELQIEADTDRPTLDGDPVGFSLAAEATRIHLAYTYDPQFVVSAAPIDPLPHQLEAVYYYMLKQPRLRFLLAVDPDAGKTIMARLLLKELKLRDAGYELDPDQIQYSFDKGVEYLPIPLPPETERLATVTGSRFGERGLSSEETVPPWMKNAVACPIRG